jgi:hypothetical protein
MREDLSILEKLGESATPGEAADAFFFHGTCEPFDGTPRGGAYDDVFWTADCPAVAQCYIPEAGGQALFCASGYQLGDRVRPDRHSTAYALVRQMGKESPDVEWGSDGRAKSWAVPDGYPTYRDVADWLENSLGYDNLSDCPDRERKYWVKSAFGLDGRETYLPASYRIEGRLYVVDGVRDLRFLDMAEGREGDLTDLDYHKHAWFRRARDEGYDGIVINDFCQSKTHGNVGHRSWGVLPRALGKLRFAEIPCVRFDWAADESVTERLTPEFRQAWEASALERGPAFGR